MDILDDLYEQPPASEPTPLILPRHQHTLSRESIDPDALKVLYRLHHHGFHAFLVGGCVRDLLLGKTPKDFDLATDAHPQQVRELFRNSRLIGRRFRLAQVYFREGKIIEVSTFRRRSEFEEPGEDGRPPSDNTFGTPAEDAFRRDITINGIFYNLADYSLIDYVGGLDDLRRGIIRCIGDPEEKFPQDPVRMIRVIRHAARTGFTIEEDTYRSLISHADKLSLCSPARVRDEFLRELREGTAYSSMQYMIETGMLLTLFPSFRPILCKPQQKEFFLRIAAEADSLYGTGTPMVEEFALALFLAPLFLGAHLAAPIPGQGSIHQLTRGWIDESVASLQFTRYVRESAAYLLSTQKTLRDLLGKQPPHRLVRKSYFPSARLIFEITARAQGEDLQMLPPSRAEEAPRRRRKRTRRWRRRSSHPRGKENGAGDARLGEDIASILVS